jgi:hypothetical protein
MNRQFIETSIFKKSWDAMGLNDEDLRALESVLLANPEVGALIQGSGGARKLRFAFPHRGKSGGLRVIYVDFAVLQEIYLLFAYPKSKRESLSDAEIQDLRKLIKAL